MTYILRLGWKSVGILQAAHGNTTGTSNSFKLLQITPDTKTLRMSFDEASETEPEVKGNAPLWYSKALVAANQQLAPITCHSTIWDTSDRGLPARVVMTTTTRGRATVT